VVFVLLLVAALVAAAVRGDVKAVGTARWKGPATRSRWRSGSSDHVAVGWACSDRGKIGTRRQAGGARARHLPAAFRDVPTATRISAMLLNIAAKHAGLGNAATPFGSRR